MKAPDWEKAAKALEIYNDEMKAPEGHTYVGCPDCGRVMTVLHEQGEELPYCNHHTGTPIWRAPMHASMDWKQTIRVGVITHINV